FDCAQQSGAHADEAPDDGGDGEGADDGIVVFKRLDFQALCGCLRGRGLCGFQAHDVLVFLVESEKLFARGSSSDSTRIEGVQVSSNWPERTAQMKPPRKNSAMARLTMTRMRMTFIVGGMTNDE